MNCEKCQVIHDGAFGSGRFCSRKCANSRNHDDTTKENISKSLVSYNNSRIDKKLDIVCPGCQKSFYPRKRTTKCCSRSCNMIVRNKKETMDPKQKEVVIYLQNYYKKYGKTPPVYDTDAPCSRITVVRKFGSWNNALVKAGIPVNRTIVGIKLVECEECKIFINKWHSQIKKTKHNFCSQSCGAKFNNRNKSYGTTRSKLEVFLETSLNERYPALEIVSNTKPKCIGYEIDLFIPMINLAVEINGAFHTKPIYGQEKLERIQEIDKLKQKLCEENGIELLIIDSSKQGSFKPVTSLKYLDIICERIDDIHNDE